MKLAVIDYGSGNIRSARRAVERAAREAGLPVDILLASTPEEAAACDRFILPGVGHFADCARGLRERDGLLEALEERVVKGGAPFLGVCVGMQLLADVGLEGGSTPGLGWIGGRASRLTPEPGDLPLPHIGWNTLELATGHPVLSAPGEGAHMYFVHSYALTEADPALVLARTDYGGKFISAVGRENVLGVQFHPEKSQSAGLRLLGAFLRWNP